ncbi:MAG: glycosyltransferase family 1 protein [Leptolyngbya sp.]|nr:MAG: glycosyltransferase family 1 protein [Leptolyngbya sp.]
MKILFLDQSGKPGGAELCLLDVAKPYRDRCLVGLLADGSFRELLEQQDIPVQVLTGRAIQVQKDSNLLKGLSSLGQLLPFIGEIAQLSREYDVIYANTQKALVVGAIASLLAHRPLVYHLHDIVSSEHFSAINRRLIIGLANRFSSLVIANSHASVASFIAAGGNRDRVKVVYNGFDLQRYQHHADVAAQMRQTLGLGDRFVVGHFSRLSPWKGQQVLIEALQYCPVDVVALLVGDALFGEDAFVAQLHQQVEQLGLGDRVRFLGFRSDVPQLMTMCDLIAHTSTAPEPFGRVIVEAMLCGTPIVAAAAGGVIELIEHGKTGWLSPPGDVLKLADIIQQCHSQPGQAIAIAHQAQQSASQRFNLDTTNQQIAQLLQQVVSDRG